MPPTDFNSHLEYGKTLQKQNNYAAAEVAFTAALRLNPESAEAYTLRSICRFFNHDRLGALDDARQACRFAPEDGEKWLMLASYYMMADDTVAAEQSYTRAFDLGLNQASAWGARGEARTELGNYEGALEDFDRAIQVDPQFAPAWASRGNACFETGLFEKACESWEQAVRLDPTLRQELRPKIMEAKGMLAEPEAETEAKPEPKGFFRRLFNG